MEPDTISTLTENGLTVNIMLTEQCNFACRHCFYECGPSSKKGYITQDVLSSIKDSFVKACDYARDQRDEFIGITVNLIGGEPTINLKEFERCLETVYGWLEDELIQRIEMTTNGWWLRDEEKMIAFFRAVTNVVHHERFGLDNGLTIRISNDKWHQEFQKGGGLSPERTLYSMWDDLLVKSWIECSDCDVIFKDYVVGDGDECPIKECDGVLSEFYEELIDSYIPDPRDSGEYESWIYVEKYKDDVSLVIPVGRGEDFGRNDKAKFRCAADGTTVTYRPSGAVSDICCSGSEFPIGTCSDDLIWILDQAIRFGEGQTSCFGCHDAAKAWINNRAKEVLL